MRYKSGEQAEIGDIVLRVNPSTQLSRGGHYKVTRLGGTDSIYVCHTNGQPLNAAQNAAFDVGYFSLVSR